MQKRVLRHLVPLILLLLASTASLSAATDLTGTWTTQVRTPEGLTIPVTVSLRQSGEVLTGSVAAPMAAPVSIDNGRVVGNKLSFTLLINGITVTNKGTLAGAVIRMVSTPPRNTEFPEYDLTLRRRSK